MSVTGSVCLKSKSYLKKLVFKAPNGQLKNSVMCRPRSVRRSVFACVTQVESPTEVDEGLGEFTRIKSQAAKEQVKQHLNRLQFEMKSCHLPS